MTNFDSKIQKLIARRHDIQAQKFALSESFLRSSYSTSVKYALESMAPIDPVYTQNTYKACERVQNHLRPGLAKSNIDVEFHYQGSVPTNTHIKLYSDIDLLTIHQRFVTLQPPQTPQFPYKGDPVEDLKDMRQNTLQIIKGAFPAVSIDDTGSKALSISGGSLDRKIDIISANWYDSLRYAETGDKDYRGVNILDRDNNTRILNYPSLHIYFINEKDTQVNGNEKRVIRLLKSLKVDSDREIKVSSYDITSLVYRMDNSLLLSSSTERLTLIENTNAYLLKVINNEVFRNGLYVANGTRKIFCDAGASVEEVAKLQSEVQELLNDIIKEVKPVYKTLRESNIFY